MSGSLPSSVLSKPTRRTILVGTTRLGILLFGELLGEPPMS
jgi:hypothetical protein